MRPKTSASLGTSRSGSAGGASALTWATHKMRRAGRKRTVQMDRRMIASAQGEERIFFRLFPWTVIPNPPNNCFVKSLSTFSPHFAGGLTRRRNAISAPATLLLGIFHYLNYLYPLDI